VKKVIHIVTRLEYGGTLENILTLISGLSSDYEIVLVVGSKNTVKTRIDNCSEKYNFKVIYIDELIREINPIYDLVSLCRIYNIIKKEKPNIIHTHTSKAGFLGRLAGKLCGYKNIVHTPHGHIFYGYFGKTKTKIFILLERLAAKWTRKIIVFSNAEKNDNIYFNVGKEEQFVIIPNGIDIEKFSKVNIDVATKKKELGIENSNKVIGVIGRLTPIKGHIYFIHAMVEILKRMSNIKAVIAGSGELEEDLKIKVNNLGLKDFVLFLGDRTDIPEILKICDIVVLPSLNEGFGLAIVEAEAAGKPVVATKVGGIPEVIKDGETGILVPPRDSHKLASVIISLLKDKERAEKMGLYGRDFVKNNFNKEIMLERIKRLYESFQ
jgi:glycosyltransferase involved in cell wall biosynthesis